MRSISTNFGRPLIGSRRRLWARDLKGCVLWLRADLGTSTNTWRDQSGKGNNATEATNPCTYTTSSVLNNRAVARFNGTNQLMTVSGASLNITGAVTMIAVFNVVVAAADGGVVGNGIGAHAQITNDGGTAKNWAYCSTSSTNTSYSYTAGAAAIATLTWTGDATANGMNFYDRGTAATPKTAGAGTSSANYVLGHATNFLQVDIGEVIICNRVLGPQELAQIHKSLGRYYNITVA